MDNFNLKNLQLAYGAVYDQNLCESMEELGLIGEGSSGQDQFELWVNELLDEGYDLSDYTWDELYEGYKKLPVGKMILQAVHKGANQMGAEKTDKEIFKMARVAERHSQIKGKGKVRGEGQAELNRRRGEMKEDYDVFDVVLEYLLDEGFADTLEGAEAIMVNMSEGWIEGILEAREPGVKPYRANRTMAEINAEGRKKKKSDSEGTGYGPDEKFKGKNDTALPTPETSARLSSEKPYAKRMLGPMGREYGSRAAAEVTRVVRGAGEPRAVKFAQDKKPRRVLPDPDRSNRAPKPKRVIPSPKR
jgi:hypothetical protein